MHPIENPCGSRHSTTLDVVTAITAAIGLASWISTNPFGEPTAYLLAYPQNDDAVAVLAADAERFTFKRLDAEGDILWVGTDTLQAALRAMQVEFWSGDDVWARHPVGDEWTGAAIARRYVVLVIGTAVTDANSDGIAIADYLSQRDQVFTGLVKIRLKVTDG